MENPLCTAHNHCLKYTSHGFSSLVQIWVAVVSIQESIWAQVAAYFYPIFALMVTRIDSIHHMFWLAVTPSLKMLKSLRKRNQNLFELAGIFFRLKPRQGKPVSVVCSV